MRTTVRVDDARLERLKAQAHKEELSLTRILNRALKAGLEAGGARLNLLLLSRDNVQVVREKDEHWETLRSLLGRTGTAGDLTTDAHLAALALSHDAVLVSGDTDFVRFSGLRREDPLRSA